ncbi:MAG: hypothetical protein Tp176DCM1853251_72 [Prokaryotic dsDNA virus sp.]|nr:MAG: hypothetical protein Tp176DCM1853251_72 [Prokaryotic dsDNA virus sp.]|tara:strand:- start:2473 stop:2907 length:435 start_codon:yes stop_codon:yes gene_type:complete
MTFLEVLDRHGRFGAWMTSAAMVLIAMTFALPGDSMRFSQWWALRDLGFKEVTIATFAMCVGSCRLLILWVNGAWHRTPLLRGIGAVAGLCFYGVMAILSLWPWLSGAVSALDTLTAVYAVLAAADLRECHRAGFDHRGAKLVA